MGLFHWGLPSFLLEWATEQGVRRGIETGTFRGDSARAIADAVGACTTIELSDPLFAAAHRRFENDRRITVLHGSSASLLSTVCADLAEPTIFWLDAHYSGGITAGADAQCPVMAELDALASDADLTRHIVCIDDARLFGFVPTAPPGRHDWPSLHAVLSRLESLGLRTYVVDDVVVGIEPHRVDSFERLLWHRDVRQHLVLHDSWRVIRFWLRWSPKGLRRHLPSTIRRSVRHVARRVLPRKWYRRLKRLVRR